MLPGYDPISLDRVVRRVATDSAGLPLFAVELLRAVALGLDLGTIAGTWPEPLRTLDQSLPGDLPDAVVAAIRVAFRRLSPAAQRVLVSAAVLGDLAAPAVLERALEMDADDVARALDELEWHRWLVSEPRGYSFAARIVRQVVQREMVTPGQRRRVLEAARESHPRDGSAGNFAGVERLLPEEGLMSDRGRRMRPMRRLIITPSSMPLVPAPGPLLEFIRQAQLSLVYARERRAVRSSSSSP